MRAWLAPVVRPLACACLLLITGCLVTPRVETLLHRGPEGAVSLKEFPDASYQADHPVSVDPALLRRALAGLQIKEERTVLEATLSGEAPWMPAFELGELEHLAPLLATGLSRATPSEAVHFLVERPSPGGTFRTAGSVHVTGVLLHLVLVEYGPSSGRPGTLSQPSRSFTRPPRWTLGFHPRAALDGGQEVDAGTSAEVGPGAMRISLETLAAQPDAESPGRAPRGGTRPAAPGPDPAPTRPREDATGESAGESLQEIQRLRRLLEQQDERLERLERQLERR